MKLLLLGIFIFSSYSFADINEELILGDRDNLKLAMVSFDKFKAELVDVNSINVVDNILHLERHTRYYRDDHAWEYQSTLYNEEFNCNNRTIKTNLAYIYTYYNMDVNNLTELPFPEAGSVKRGGDLLNSLCGLINNLELKSNAYKESVINEVLYQTNKTMIADAPIKSFSPVELFIPTFDNKGNVIKAEFTDVMRFLQKVKNE